MDKTYTIRVLRGEEHIDIVCAPNQKLLEVLQQNEVAMYGTVSRWINCKGRGLCATCGVRVHKGPKAVHWHDKAAYNWGYPRLSCQILVTEDMTVALIEDKIMWGQLLPNLAR